MKLIICSIHFKLRR